VTAQEYAMIQAGRAARAEQLAREKTEVHQTLPDVQVDEQTPQISRAPGLRDQSRRSSASGIQKATFHGKKLEASRRGQPRSHQRTHRDDYIQFDRGR
jgi:hypothetical protein